MQTAFDVALMHGILLLRGLPRRREEGAEARKGMDSFRTAPPGGRADLLVDKPPASRKVDYDLLLTHPDGGTVALTWRADEGIPWSVQYADHWAANYVVTVDADHVTVQEALLALKLAGRRHPDLM